MLKQKKTISTYIISLFIILAIGLSGCSKQPAVVQTPAEPATPEPTATATQPAARIILFDPANLADQSLSGMLSEFATANALGFETWSTLGASLDGVKIMILEGTLDNLAEVAANTPQTQFVIVSQSVTASGNISVISVDPVQMAFMAGFLSVMVAEDWRAAALITDGGNLGLGNAFENGGTYLCGTCPSTYSPLLYYPFAYQVDNPADQASWLAVAATMLTEKVPNTVYIDAGGDNTALLDQLSGDKIIGNNPGSPNLTRYTAILGPNVISTLQQALPELLAGDGGKTLSTPVSVLVNNAPDLLTEPKIALFNQTALDLINNKIIPLSIP